MELTKEILKELAKPFPVEKIGLKVQSVFNKEADESNALIVAFIDARDVGERLDSVVGGEWWDFYSKAPSGGLECALTVCGVTRRDVGSDDNDTETEKSGYSDSFKRAGVKFGIGRYIYDMPKMFGMVEKKGKNWYPKPAEVTRLRRGMAGDASAFNAQPASNSNTQRTTTTNTQPTAPSTQANKPAMTNTDKTATEEQKQKEKFERTHPPLSPVQRNKLVELWKLLNGGMDVKDELAFQGLDKLFTESFRHGLADATYEDGARLTGELLTQLRAKTNGETTNMATATATNKTTPSFSVPAAPKITATKWDVLVTRVVKEGLIPDATHLSKLYGVLEKNKIVEVTDGNLEIVYKLFKSELTPKKQEA